MKVIELMEKDGNKKLKGEQINLTKFLKMYRDRLTSQGIVFSSADVSTLRRASLNNNIKVLKELITEIIDEDEKGKNLY